jgi:hypothetical protein
MRYLILVLTLFLTVKTFGCDCAWGGDFLKLSNESAIIFQLEVLGHEKLDRERDEILIAKVLKLYKGNLKSDTVRLRGDDGNHCAPYVSQFKIGERYIAQILRADWKDLWLRNCGEFDLKIKGDTINPELLEFGHLPQTTKISLASFEEALRDTLGAEANFRTIEHITEKKTPFDKTIALLGLLGLIVLGWIYKRKQRHHNTNHQNRGSK